MHTPSLVCSLLLQQWVVRTTRFFEVERLSIPQKGVLRFIANRFLVLQNQKQMLVRVGGVRPKSRQFPILSVLFEEVGASEEEE